MDLYGVCVILLLITIMILVALLFEKDIRKVFIKWVSAGIHKLFKR
jgi:hypothetical protein